MNRCLWVVMLSLLSQGASGEKLPLTAKCDQLSQVLWLDDGPTRQHLPLANIQIANTIPSSKIQVLGEPLTLVKIQQLNHGELLSREEYSAILNEVFDRRLTPEDIVEVTGFAVKLRPPSYFQPRILLFMIVRADGAIFKYIKWGDDYFVCPVE